MNGAAAATQNSCSGWMTGGNALETIIPPGAKGVLCLSASCCCIIHTNWYVTVPMHLARSSVE